MLLISIWMRGWVSWSWCVSRGGLCSSVRLQPSEKVKPWLVLSANTVSIGTRTSGRPCHSPEPASGKALTNLRRWSCWHGHARVRTHSLRTHLLPMFWLSQRVPVCSEYELCSRGDGGPWYKHSSNSVSGAPELRACDFSCGPCFFLIFLMLFRRQTNHSAKPNQTSTVKKQNSTVVFWISFTFSKHIWWHISQKKQLLHTPYCLALWEARVGKVQAAVLRLILGCVH